MKGVHCHRLARLCLILITRTCTSSRHSLCTPHIHTPHSTPVSGLVHAKRTTIAITSSMPDTYLLVDLPALFSPECVLQRSPVCLLQSSVPVCRIGEVCVQFLFLVSCQEKIVKLRFLQISEDFLNCHLPVSLLVAHNSVNKYLFTIQSRCLSPSSVTEDRTYTDRQTHEHSKPIPGARGRAYHHFRNQHH